MQNIENSNGWYSGLCQPLLYVLMLIRFFQLLRYVCENQNQVKS